MTGFGRNTSDTKMMSLFEAMNRNIVVEQHGIRMLEAQIATGGTMTFLSVLILSYCEFFVSFSLVYDFNFKVKYY